VGCTEDPKRINHEAQNFPDNLSKKLPGWEIEADWTRVIAKLGRKTQDFPVDRVGDHRVS
jgi:hypothetical protein